MNRTSPPNSASERAFVGALMLLPPSRTRAALSLVEEGDLADPHLRVVLEAIRRLAREDSPVDAVAVQAHLRSSGNVSTASMSNLAMMLAELVSVDTVPLPEAIEKYAAAVVEESVRRRLAELAVALQELADQSPRERIESHSRVLTSLMLDAASRLHQPFVAGVS